MGNKMADNKSGDQKKAGGIVEAYRMPSGHFPVSRQSTWDRLKRLSEGLDVGADNPESSEKS